MFSSVFIEYWDIALKQAVKASSTFFFCFTIDTHPTKLLDTLKLLQSKSAILYAKAPVLQKTVECCLSISPRLEKVFFNYKLLHDKSAGGYTKEVF
jgi:hypothetical protein